MRNGRLTTVIAATCVAVGCALPAAAAPGLESDLVDHYSQVVYELDGPEASPVLRVKERIVDAAGREVGSSVREAPAAVRPHGGPRVPGGPRPGEGQRVHPADAHGVAQGLALALFNDNRFARNQAAGWWEHGCRPACRRWNGSAEFQGSVAEALFEFPSDSCRWTRATSTIPLRWSISAATRSGAEADAPANRAHGRGGFGRGGLLGFG